MLVAEGLLATPFTESLRGGAGGVHTNILTIDPRVLGHHGRPKYALGPQDGGELSGVVWYVERVLDPAHKHPLTAVEDGLAAVEEYKKVDRRGRPKITVISELENSLTQAIVKGDYWESPAGQTQRLFEALKVDR